MVKTYRPKVCLSCGNIYTPTGTNQKVCTESACRKWLRLQRAHPEGPLTGYIYGLFDASRPLLLWECRYIGKILVRSPEDRRKRHLYDARTSRGHSRRNNWIKSVLAGNQDIVLQIFETHEAKTKGTLNKILCERERIWISEGRRQGWDLTNNTDGGDGAAGFRHKPESIAKMKAWQRPPWTPEQRAAQSARRKGRPGKPHTAASKAKMSASQKEHAKTHPATAAQRAAAAENGRRSRGRTHTSEAKSKMSAAHIGRVYPAPTPEQRANQVQGCLKREQRKRDAGPTTPRLAAPGFVCRIPDCDSGLREVGGQGLCQRDYNRWFYGRIQVPGLPNPHPKDEL